MTNTGGVGAPSLDAQNGVDEEEEREEKDAY